MSPEGGSRVNPISWKYDVLGAGVVVEGALPHALLPDPVEVDVGDRPARTVGEALGLGEQPAALVDHRLPVPGQVGRRLPLTAGGIGVRRGAARARRPDELVAVLGTGDGDRASREVRQHRRTSQRGIGTGWDRHPHVLADLDEEREPGHVRRAEDQVPAERHALAAHGDGLAALVLPRGEPAGLVELPVGRQERLGRHPEDRAAVDHHGTVVDPVALAQRRSDDEHRTQVRARLDDRRDRPVRRPRAACPAGTGRRSSSRSGTARRRSPPRRPRRGSSRASVRTVSALAGGVADRDRQGAGGDPREAVRVGRFEVHTHSVTERAGPECVLMHPSRPCDRGDTPAAAGRSSVDHGPGTPAREPRGDALRGSKELDDERRDSAVRQRRPEGTRGSSAQRAPEAGPHPAPAGDEAARRAVRDADRLRHVHRARSSTRPASRCCSSGTAPPTTSTATRPRCRSPSTS